MSIGRPLPASSGAGAGQVGPDRPLHVQHPLRTGWCRTSGAGRAAHHHGLRLYRLDPVPPAPHSPHSQRLHRGVLRHSWATCRPAASITWTGSVRPEGCQDRPDSPQGPMMECPVREPCPPKCCYPDMRRSNPPCEAPGTTATIWEHQSGGGPAEDGRLNASERPLSRSVIENRPKVLTGRGQKGMRVGSSIGTLDDGGTRTRRTIGRSRPIRLSTLDNRVSPTRPVAARRRYSDRKEGDGGGGRGCRRKRRLSL